MQGAGRRQAYPGTLRVPDKVNLEGDPMLKTRGVDQLAGGRRWRLRLGAARRARACSPNVTASPSSSFFR